MLITPTPAQLLTIHQNGQIDPSDLSTLTSSSPSLIQTDPNLIDKPEYLLQLLKDRRQLAVVPNVFIHVERLLDQEINRVRMNLFNLSPHNRVDLPEPTGEKKIIQEKVFIPVQQYPEFNFVGRILGPRGMTSKQLEAETDCKIMIRGRGSMRDKQKEEQHRGKPNWEHLDEDLHVLIQCEDYENRALMKVERAKEEITKLLKPSVDGEDYIKKKQLTELAIINGTYRDPNMLSKKLQFSNNQIPIGAPLILTQQNYLPGQMLSSTNPSLFTTTTHPQSTLTGLQQPSFESNFLQVFTPYQTFDHMGLPILTSEPQLFEYPTQSAYSVFPTTASQTGVASRSTNNNSSRNFTATSSSSVSARYQPYTTQPSHLKRS